MSQHVGIEIGGQKTMVVCDDADIIRTDTGSISRPTLVTFNGKERYTGEEAFAHVASEFTIPMLSSLIGKSFDEVSTSETFKHRRTAITQDSSGRLQAEVDYIRTTDVTNDSSHTKLQTTSLMGMFLSDVWKRISSVCTTTGASTTESANPTVQVSFVLPCNYSKSVERAYREASAIAGIPSDKVHVADSADCLIAAYNRKLSGLGPAERELLEHKHILILDMGHTQTTAVVVKVVPVPATDENKQNKDHMVDVVKVAVRHDGDLGALHFDVRIFDHLAAQFKASNPNQAEIVPGTKRGFRLLQASEKLRKLLSQLAEGQITVEHLSDDSDSKFTMRRETLADITADLLNRVKALVESAINDATLAAYTGSDTDSTATSTATAAAATTTSVPLAAVEVLGGGVRMQIVQQAIHTVVGSDAAFGAKLDDATLSLGAALISKHTAAAAAAAAAVDSSTDTLAAAAVVGGGGVAESTDSTQPVPPTPPTPAGVAATADVVDVAATAAIAAATAATTAAEPVPVVSPDLQKDSIGLTADELTAARQMELNMQNQDQELRLTMDARNNLESFLLEMRSAPNKKHGNSIDRSRLNTLLDEYENWMWDTFDASLDALQSKTTSLKTAVAEICKAYFEATEKERLEVEKQLELESARAAAEKEAAGGEDDDHDTRKLKKPDRMRMVVKNKEEGTELFKGKNFRPAAARYHKALTHCAKFFDLTKEDEVEVNTIKLSLYLNLASCYIKLENWDQLLRNCEEALLIDGQSVKALFRRSTYYEKKKEWDLALADVKCCQKLLQEAELPEDKAINLAVERIKREIQKEKNKEKKTWGKMFA